MAKLSSGRLTFELRLRDYEYGWVQYEVLFLWENEPLINDALLKRHNKHWAARSFGAFKANEYREDSLLPVLANVLRENKADFWDLMEPDVVIAFYPESFFPFLPSKWQVVWESEEEIVKQEEQQQLREANQGFLPDDWIQMIVFVDTYNFRNTTAYVSEGIALHMRPTRAELEVFYEELKEEYERFVVEYQVNEYRDEEE